jgi:hypothetical protein
MTDQAMIRWLRGQVEWCNSQSSYGPADNCARIADRLETLSRPREESGKRPVTHADEAKMREHVRTGEEYGWTGAAREDLARLRDLLALLDWEREQRHAVECMMADLCADGEALVGVGAARALAEIMRGKEKYDSRSHVRDELDRLWESVRKACGPATLPPHLRTLERVRRLEDELRKIASARCEDRTNPEALDWLRGMAREALEDTSQ